jgi:peroxiredoxin
MGVSIANRNTFLIDPTGKIAQVWTKVNPATAASSVLAAIPGAK